MAGVSSTPISIDFAAEYSPVSALSIPASAPGSPPTPSIPNITELDLVDAWSCLSDQMLRTTGTQTACSMLDVYSLHAEEWANMLMSKCSVHVLSGPQSEESIPGFKAVFVHSTLETLKKRMPSGELGEPCAFGSALAWGTHRVAHHHYGLSHTTLNSSVTPTHVSFSSCLLTRTT
eukprot:3506033-Amphidinium_carterae.4